MQKYIKVAESETDCSDSEDCEGDEDLREMQKYIKDMEKSLHVEEVYGVTTSLHTLTVAESETDCSDSEDCEGDEDLREMQKYIKDMEKSLHVEEVYGVTTSLHTPTIYIPRSTDTRTNPSSLQNRGKKILNIIGRRRQTEIIISGYETDSSYSSDSYGSDCFDFELDEKELREYRQVAKNPDRRPNRALLDKLGTSLRESIKRNKIYIPRSTHTRTNSSLLKNRGIKIINIIGRRRQTEIINSGYETDSSYSSDNYGSGWQELREYRQVANYSDRRPDRATLNKLGKSLRESIKRNEIGKMFPNVVKGSSLHEAPEEIAQDPYKLTLYEKAIKDGTERDRSIRINVVGSYKQGKTTLVKRLLYLSIFGVKRTNGIEVRRFSCFRSTRGKLTYSKSKRITHKDIMNRLLTVQITEEERLSMESYNEIQYLKPSCTESTDVKQTEPMYEFHDEINRKHAKTTCHVPENQTNEKHLALNARFGFPKQDTLSTKYQKLFAKKANKKEQNEKRNNDASINFWDFGGQFIFYATHSLFHSRKAIYLLVFDLTLPLDQLVISEEDLPFQPVNRSAEHYLRFWMNSIHSFVGTEDGTEPVVILVGTHKDKIQGKHAERMNYIAKFFNDVKALFHDTNVLDHVYTRAFAIDNMDTKDPELLSLREAILTIGEDRSKSVAIPAKWIQLEKALDEIKDRKLITVQMVLEIDASTKFPIKDIEQIKLFLQYHHAKGTLVYFDESPVSNYVVVEPQFLIDAFKCIITSSQFYNSDVPFELTRLLHTEARLEKSLIDYQWGRNKLFLENKEVLLGFLEKHRIITQASVFDEASETSSGLGWYIVPSLLKDEHFQTEVKRFLQGKRLTRLQFVMIFQDSTVVELVFHRLLSAVAGKWPIAKYNGSQVMIYQNACVIHFSKHAGILEHNAKEIRLAVVSCCPSVSVHSKETDLFRRFCESVIQHEFKKLKTCDESQPKAYVVRFACNHEDHEGRGSINYIEQDASKTVPCPDLLSHDLCFEQAQAEWYMEDRFTNFGRNIKLNENVLSNLSRCIGENWELLGIQLGLSQVQIDHLKADERTTIMRVYKMLLSWRSIKKAVTLEKFVEAVEKTPTLTVDWDGIRNIADDI